jgi:hypothetical protein
MSRNVLMNFMQTYNIPLAFDNLSNLTFSFSQSGISRANKLKNLFEGWVNADKMMY